MIAIVMGVAGSGKTTIGKLLAEEVGWAFYEGDDFHPPANVDKMRRGIPLSDQDREPWLRALRALIEDLLRNGKHAVIACSALKEEYRMFLKQGDDDVRFIYLKGSYALIHERLRKRRGHFMGASLLESQFETLEEPSDEIIVDISPEPQKVVENIKKLLKAS